LGSETQTLRIVELRDTLASNEEKVTGNKNKFIDIDLKEEDRDNDNVPSVIGGSFVTITRGIRLKKTKPKES
jgi:hypothetical protein